MDPEKTGLPPRSSFLLRRHCCYLKEYKYFPPAELVDQRVISQTKSAETFESSVIVTDY